MAKPSGPSAISHAASRTLGEKVRPLELDVRADAPQRVNLLVPTIDLEHFFGGYLAKLNLARRLAERGLRVRIVTVDETSPLPRDWRRTIEAYQGLQGVFDRVEIAFGRENAPLELSPTDALIATTWWTAHIAGAALESLERERFLYLIQEYEPFTFPMGALAALARQSYDLPHFALFSTELLREWFRENRIGAFASARGEDDSVAFENALTPIAPPSAAELAVRRSRRLLFYARPEPHAARNMFELGLLALSQAVGERLLTSEWELHGVGTVEGPTRIELGEGIEIELMPRRDQDSYAELMREHDVGLALMYTPHPSLVPIEMASAGMLTVTNSFENKTAEKMAAISPNLLAFDPSLAGISAALREAIGAVDDYGRRAGGAKVRWSRDWNQSFDDRLLERVERYLEDC